ncbi:MAG TPA: DUF302 domain-containing protein [Anaerolineales bacterium]|nr:DUF302 domain-containing protein [Anaerolineales bacterium]
MKNNIGFESKLNHEFEESFQLLAEALKSEGFGILTQIDVRKTFKEKINEDFRRYAILGVCNPPLAHKVLSHNAEAGLLLPCTITIESDEEGTTTVRILDPLMMLQIGDMGKDDVLRQVGEEAREKLLRVAANLK